MRAYLTDANGGTYELPALLSWRLTHTDGSSADAFEMQCAYEPGMQPLLCSAARFRAMDGGETEFYGVVDECQAIADSSGAVLEVSGRGLAALLMDNEAEAVEYTVCSIDDILREHVRPYGITDISCGSLKSIYEYSIKSGESEWEVLTDFVRWAEGGTPRFSKTGKLLIAAEDGETFRLSESCGITAVKYQEKRYGVISEVIVKGNTNGMRSTVYNGDFIDRGGMCRRIVCVPNVTRYDAMRYTGEYQIEQSEKDSSLVTVAISEPLYAFAGDHVEAELPHMGISGKFSVRESVSWADGDSCGTELLLAPEN